MVKANKDNYKYIKFYYDHGGSMKVNKFTYKNVYPDEIKQSKSYEYLFK